MSSRRILLVCALVGSAVLTACGTHASSAGPASSPATASQAGSHAVSFHLTTGATDGDRHAFVGTAGDVHVSGGRLTSVSLTTAAGRPVTGSASADRSRWTPASPLAYDTSYRLVVHAADAAGRVRTRDLSFTTMSKAERLIGTFTPEDGSVVGVGMPVSLTFNMPVTDKRAVEAAVKVTDDSGQQVVGHWFGDQRLDLRPQEYWKAHTRVTLTLRLAGVKGAAGGWGVQDKQISFTVGRRQVSTVDVTTDTMRVVRDGKLLRTIPITSGAPGRTTYNGQMVISQKLISTEMDGATVGYAGQYDIPDVPHAMRLSSSGTFIHGNYWAPDSVFGHSDVSHGCVGLNDVRGGGDPDQPAAWFYDNSLVGDVVVVEHSHDHTIAPDNGLNGWNMDWTQWKKGSALG
ncbi:Ig-like domain-containing protein [Actinacidiphila sp. DG2A-62]|uniref:L,D-transpeptidase n=1 Tax=Actinacidiphila sp. DG2A-62 TaxID=3108821 RepID=UPI002DB63E08|nr:Ig-like domain-containing protein [Actinacidiphila sp. DG2A-62]MEC3993939.1 Ig-like domain-containing protein [Actinacidiphila sp. DG2A-62]